MRSIKSMKSFKKTIFSKFGYIEFAILGEVAQNITLVCKKRAPL